VATAAIRTDADVDYRGVVLVVGDEEFLLNRAIEEVGRARRRMDPSADVVELEGAAVVAAELYEVLSPSLFGGLKTVVIRNAQDVPAAVVPALTGFFADPGDDIVLLIQHLGAAKGKSLLDASRQAASATITCAKLKRPADREDFIRSEARRARATISSDAVAGLVEAIGTDLRELAAVTAQLASDSGGKIDARIVAAFHQGRAQVTGFAVADAVIAGDARGALESLRWAQSVGVPAVLIADALADGVRSIAKVGAAGRGNPNMLAAKLGMPPWKVERAQRQARGWTEAGLHEAMQTVATLNAEVKGAVADADFALENALRVLARARTRPN
jgi:DNA polymerase-3 subunit delta